MIFDKKKEKGRKKQQGYETNDMVTLNNLLDLTNLWGSAEIGSSEPASSSGTESLKNGEGFSEELSASFAQVEAGPGSGPSSDGGVRAPAATSSLFIPPVSIAGEAEEGVQTSCSLFESKEEGEKGTEKETELIPGLCLSSSGLTNPVFGSAAPVLPSSKGTGETVEPTGKGPDLVTPALGDRTENGELPPQKADERIITTDDLFSQEKKTYSEKMRDRVTEPPPSVMDPTKEIAPFGPEAEEPLPGQTPVSVVIQVSDDQRSLNSVRQTDGGRVVSEKGLDTLSQSALSDPDSSFREPLQRVQTLKNGELGEGERDGLSKDFVEKTPVLPADQASDGIGISPEAKDGKEGHLSRTTVSGVFNEEAIKRPEGMDLPPDKSEGDLMVLRGERTGREEERSEGLRPTPPPVMGKNGETITEKGGPEKVRFDQALRGAREEQHPHQSPISEMKETIVPAFSQRSDGPGSGWSAERTDAVFLNGAKEEISGSSVVTAEGLHRTEFQPGTGPEGLAFSLKTEGPVRGKETAHQPLALIKEALEGILYPERPLQVRHSDGKSVELVLDPGGLGQIEVELNLNRDLLQGQITVQDPTQKELIERNLNQLMNDLIREGLQIGGFTVALKQRERGFFPLADKPEEREGPFTSFPSSTAPKKPGNEHRLYIIV